MTKRWELTRHHDGITARMHIDGGQAVTIVVMPPKLADYILAQAAALAGRDHSRAEQGAEIERLRAALDTLATMIVGAHLHSNPTLLLEASWRAAQYANSLEQSHQFVPMSGTRNALGVYTRCSVNGCTLAPDQHPSAPPEAR